MKILLICFSAWAIAQIVKFIVGWARDHEINWSYFVSSGGMPSSHSSTVSALATSIGLIYGIDNPYFPIAAILAMVVMYDAAGVRRAVSRQAFILNRLMREIRLQKPREELGKELWELVGHSPFQVFIGAALGIIIACIWVLLT
ncbi:MAG: divergent PAP2 family protein [Dehalococcoidales bacterium]|nr:divergent PAP2 family protein [Dehalococcoidales bacterium]